MPPRKRLSAAEALVILGILLAVVISVLNRTGLAPLAARITVAGFVIMAVLVPTLLLRQYLRERRHRGEEETRSSEPEPAPPPRPRWLSPAHKEKEMGFFRRLFKGIDPFETPCRCGKTSQVRVAPEREFDFRTGEVYCLTCLAPLVKQALAERAGGCVVVQPYADAPCLVPYSMEELRDFTAWPSRLAELSSAAQTRCGRCEAQARGLLWIATDPGQSLAAMQTDSGWFDQRRGAARCPDCLTADLIATIEDRGLRIEELVFPPDGDSAWLPWAY